MNDLEKLVPSREVCAELKERLPRHFEPSVLVWKEYQTGMLFPPTDWGICPRYQVNRHDNFLPAPLLEEIAEFTPGSVEINFEERVVESREYNSSGETMHEGWGKDWCDGCNKNAATAALRLYLRIEESQRDEDQF